MNKNRVAIIWDWNGTIVNDAFLFTNILNRFLLKEKKGTLTVNQYRSSFFFPVVDFYKHLGLYKNKDHFYSLNKSFIHKYKKNMLLPDLVPGIKDVLRFFNKKKVLQLVLSAQNQKSLNILIEHYKLKKYFVNVVGVNNDFAEGKKEQAQLLLKKLSTEIDRFVFVGDSLLDASIAQQTGSSCVLVSWGHYNAYRLLCQPFPVNNSVDSLQKTLFSFCSFID